ncbi:ABC transporter substrate-binding protein [Rhodovarius crocodyli]|uniref:ABC transporter substrate-binding protein n=1 Tax=Rhodovarius crocodyli TaxID=1979269 RepID=A0A437MLY9_9PROT|nr:ABC transporter substrate-binding protein [Rhodovarius crocodyli]RVT98633.1 ABC transporter substrate-binding protein [Rhodovarius crocodyli]
MVANTVSRRGAFGLGAGLAAASGARAADPKRIIGVIEEDPPFMNLAISSGISSSVASAPVYSALTRMDAKGDITGDLAERWDISPDGKTYTFHLREGVTWHDGRPFTSADAQFSLGELNSKLNPYRGALKSIDSIDAPDPRTVVLKLKNPQASLMVSLGNFCGAILPKHLWEGTDPARNPHNKNPIGTGPFKFVSFSPGDRITYAKNENYFIPGKPAFDELIFRIIPDPAARMAAFTRGEIDMVYSSALPATEIPRVRRMRGVDLRFSAVQASSYQAYINIRNAPFDDVRVRRALFHAIDRKFVRDSVFPGLAQEMVGPVPPNSPLYNRALTDYALDPARANALLDEAGKPRGAGGVRFDLRYLFGAADLSARKIGEVMAQNLAAVGIRVVLTPLDRGTLIQRAYVAREFDMVITSFALGPDPDVGVERFYNSNNIFPVQAVNCSPYVNPEVDRLFDEQRVQTDPARRKAIYDRIQEIVWRDVPTFPFCCYSLPGAVRTSFATGVFDTVDAPSREDFAFAAPAGR